jgi:hypothetical protein
MADRWGIENSERLVELSSQRTMRGGDRLRTAGTKHGDGISARLLLRAFPRIPGWDSIARHSGYGTGTTGGAPLSFTKKTRNLAGWVSLAFFETVWMSSGDS